MTMFNQFGFRPVALTGAVLACIATTFITTAAAEENVKISRDSFAAYEHYRTLQQPQFFALSADGQRYGYSYCPDGLCPRQTSPTHVAIEACRLAGGQDCRIVATGTSPAGTFSPFGQRTKDPLAEEMFRVTRDLVPKDQISDDELWSLIGQTIYALYGALAYSPRFDRWGLASDLDNAPIARDIALQRCGTPDCELVLEMGPQTVCVGYGIGSGGPTFATGKTDFSARKAAEQECAKSAKGCSRIATECSGRAAGK